MEHKKCKVYLHLQVKMKIILVYGEKLGLNQENNGMNSDDKIFAWPKEIYFNDKT